MEVGNNIISSLGAGSGINSGSIVEQLVEIERSSKQAPIDAKRDTYESQISAYGLMRSALSLLQDSADLLSDEDSFGAKNATFTNSDALVPASLGSDAPAGDYTFEVLEIATSQSLSTNASFSTVNDEVGEGVLTFSFGAWADTFDVDLNPESPESFTLDTERDAFNITIDDTNNSLSGLRDAINAADEGVQASIINDGGAFRLVISADSGASNELKITVAEAGGTPTNTDANDLSRFAFDEGVAGANQQLVLNQVGNDASLVVNGLTISRSSNTIDDVIEDFEFSLVQAAPGEIMTISIFDDTAAAEASVRGFVDAYNAFLEAIEPLVSTVDADDEEEASEEAGSLYRDSTSNSIISNIRNTLANEIPGLSGGFTSLAAIGMRTELDGSLGIDEETFSQAFEENFDLVKALFAPEVSSSDAGVAVTGFGAQTVPGNYDVVITQDPSRGDLVGVASTADLSAAGVNDYDFTITVDGTTSGTISLTAGTYTDDELAAHIQSQINNDSELMANNVDVEVVWDTDHFVVTSNDYGSNGAITVALSGGSSANLGLDAGSGGTSTEGTDVAGTFDGVTGFGVGNVLLAALNTDPSGLTLLVDPGTTSTTVNFSGGFGRELSTLLDNVLQSRGVLDAREDSLDIRLDRLDVDQEQADRRVSAYQARLQSQFLAMERIVASISSSGALFEGLLDRLPFTASQ